MKEVIPGQMQFTTKCVGLSLAYYGSTYQQLIPTKSAFPKRTLIWVVHNTKKMHAFLEDASFLKDNDDKKITIDDLISRMEENLENSEHGIVTRTCN